MSSEPTAAARNGVLVTGAAGFIGSHLVDRLLSAGHRVIGVDNFRRGTRSNLALAFAQPAFTFIELDLADEAASCRVLPDIMRAFAVTRVWHMAANSDIAAGIADPSIDLRDTFLTTHALLSAIRRSAIRGSAIRRSAVTEAATELVFASTSAVYGELDRELTEETGPLLPISHYGAMKLASEAAISATVGGGLSRAWIFRFPNVVGSRGTHGVIFDLLHKLRHSTDALEVLGDGNQCKPYMHVTDLLDGMAFLVENADLPINLFNLAPDGEGTSVREIADSLIRLAAPGTPIRYTGGDRGWRGDVPRFRYSTARAKALGWVPQYESAAAVRRAIAELHSEILGGGHG